MLRNKSIKTVFYENGWFEIRDAEDDEAWLATDEPVDPGARR